MAEESNEDTRAIEFSVITFLHYGEIAGQRLTDHQDYLQQQADKVEDFLEEHPELYDMTVEEAVEKGIFVHN
jgi:hypothetical protein